jgi:magnesium transporter
MGGNAATQTMAVTVRALATNQLTSSNTWRMIAREWWIASANGWGWRADGGGHAAYLSRYAPSVVVLAMVLTSLNAGLSGAADPAGAGKDEDRSRVVSTVFVTTMTDTLGFFFFLGLASLLLM